MTLFLLVDTKQFRQQTHLLAGSTETWAVSAFQQTCSFVSTTEILEEFFLHPLLSLLLPKVLEGIANDDEYKNSTLASAKLTDLCGWANDVERTANDIGVIQFEGLVGKLRQD